MLNLTNWISFYLISFYDLDLTRFEYIIIVLFDLKACINITLDESCLCLAIICKGLHPV